MLELTNLNSINTMLIDLKNYLVQKEFNDALRLVKILNQSHKAYFAGGCVRDFLLMRPVTDFDIATDALPENIIVILSGVKIKFLTTGLKHGTVSAVIGKNVFEITTFRKDVATDGRHAAVSFKKVSQEEDARRRDFTINGLFMNEEGAVLDFVNGFEDLASKTLRFIGSAEARIQEDYLRILRFFRFQSQLGFGIDSEGFLQCGLLKSGLLQISVERKTQELKKLCEGDFFETGFKSLLEADILAGTFPGVSFCGFTPDRIVKVSKLQKKWRWLAVVTLSISVAEKREQANHLKLLKLSNEEKTQIRTLLRFSEHCNIPIDSPGELMEVIDLFEKSSIPFLPTGYGILSIILTATEVVKQLEKLRLCEEDFGHIRMQNVPFNGDDMMKKFDLKPGLKVAEKLKSERILLRNRLTQKI